MKLWKMNGAGNAFAIFDARSTPFAPSVAPENGWRRYKVGPSEYPDRKPTYRPYKNCTEHCIPDGTDNPHTL